MNGTPRYALCAQRSARLASAVEYMTVNAVIHTATAAVIVKKAALVLVKRRSTTRRPNARIKSAVTATGMAYGENTNTADIRAGMDLLDLAEEREGSL